MEKETATNIIKGLNGLKDSLIEDGSDRIIKSIFNLSKSNIWKGYVRQALRKHFIYKSSKYADYLINDEKVAMAKQNALQTCNDENILFRMDDADLTYIEKPRELDIAMYTRMAVETLISDIAKDVKQSVSTVTEG